MTIDFEVTLLICHLVVSYSPTQTKSKYDHEISLSPFPATNFKDISEKSHLTLLAAEREVI